MTLHEFMKGIISTFSIILVLAVLIGVLSFLHVNAVWVAFLGFMLWSSFGMSFELKEINKVWISLAIGLLPGICMTYMSIQPFAMALMAMIMLTLMFCMNTGKLSYLFNMYTAFSMLVSTCIPGLTHSVYYDWLISYLLLGILPYCIKRVLPKKENCS